jgi:tRNA modification GTPase
LIKNIDTTVNQLLESFKLGNVIKNGVSVAIVGKPNAGKSTLLNTLLNENRAIVSEIAGTTRDTIEETININGILFRLIDTAGIREHSQDVIENMGVVKSKEKIKQANIVLYLFDVNELKSGELSEIIVSIKMENPNVIIAANKTDLARKSIVSAHNENSNQIFISAKENMGIEQLKDALFSMAVGSGLNTENVVITNARHYAALAEISKSLHEIKLGLENHITGDLLAPEIRRCLYFLGEITGEITNEDRLDYIFSKFCIGK